MQRNADAAPAAPAGVATRKTSAEHHRHGRSDAAVEGLYLYGVTRSRSWRGGAPGDREQVIRVRYRDLEALVRPVPFSVPDLDEARLADHQQMVDATMRKGTILPAPFGLVFRGRRAILRFLEDQYIVIDEGLAFLDGHWELRLHVTASGEDATGLNELTTHVYSELRRFARAAIPLRAGDGRLMSAAFLVERAGWIGFVERADDINATHPELTFDLTGPWPPYDFVRMQT